MKYFFKTSFPRRLVKEGSVSIPAYIWVIEIGFSYKKPIMYSKDIENLNKIKGY